MFTVNIKWCNMRGIDKSGEGKLNLISTYTLEMHFKTPANVNDSYLKHDTCKCHCGDGIHSIIFVVIIHLLSPWLTAELCHRSQVGESEVCFPGSTIVGTKRPSCHTNCDDGDSRYYTRIHRHHLPTDQLVFSLSLYHTGCHIKKVMFLRSLVLIWHWHVTLFCKSKSQLNDPIYEGWIIKKKLPMNLKHSQEMKDDFQQVTEEIRELCVTV